MDRNSLVLKYAAPDELGIEIGGNYAPLLPKRDGCNTLSMDVFDTETLRSIAERTLPDELRGRIEEVDLVGSGGEIAAIVQARGLQGRIGHVVSSHNLEHLPNPVGFLNGCEQVLKAGGHLSMIVPDCRATFDYFRPVSTTADVLEAYVSDARQPTPRQVFSMESLHCRYEADGASSAMFPLTGDPARIKPLHTLREAYDRWVVGDPAYVDAHCWCFSPSSLELIVRDLLFLKIMRLRLREITSFNGEIFIHLQKSGEPQPEDDAGFYAVRDDLLRRIKTEQAENAASPAHA